MSPKKDRREISMKVHKVMLTKTDKTIHIFSDDYTMGGAGCWFKPIPSPKKWDIIRTFVPYSAILELVELRKCKYKREEEEE